MFWLTDALIQKIHFWQKCWLISISISPLYNMEKRDCQKWWKCFPFVSWWSFGTGNPSNSAVSFIHFHSHRAERRKNPNWRLTNRTERFCFLGDIRGLTSAVRVRDGKYRQTGSNQNSQITGSLKASEKSNGNPLLHLRSPSPPLRKP